MVASHASANAACALNFSACAWTECLLNLEEEIQYMQDIGIVARWARTATQSVTLVLLVSAIACKRESDRGAIYLEVESFNRLAVILFWFLSHCYPSVATD